MDRRRSTLRRWLDAGALRALASIVVATELCTIPLVVLGSTILHGRITAGALLMGLAVAGIVSLLVPGLVLARLRRTVRELEAQADEAASESRRKQELFAAVAQAQSDLGHAAFVVNDGGRYEYVNEAMCRITGYDEDELLSLPTAFLVAAPESREALGAELAGRLGGGATMWPERQETVVLRKDGRRVHIEYAVKKLDPARLVVIFHDVSARKRVEEELRVSERMASVGQLAAGIAHEINNPLSFVIGNLEVLARESLGPELREVVADARTGADRVRRIVQDLRIFSRDDREPPQPVELAAVIDFACNMARNHIRHRARLEVEHGAVRRVLGVEARLGQVVLNLLVNAADAIPEGRMAENLIRVRTLPAGEEVALEVSDTGAGMSREVAERMFDPFFTTKPVGSGMGLGLSIAHRVVTDLGGAIGVDTAPGRGTTFRVTLPAAGSATSATSAPAPAPDPSAAPVAEIADAPMAPVALPPGVARVLVIDDEKALGNALRRQLRPHVVVSVTDGAEALRILRADHGFDLILCDLIMPEMTGMDVHRHLARELPDLVERMVFMTGGAFTPAAEAFLRGGERRVVEKPFDMRQLERLIAERVAPPAPPGDAAARSVA